MIKKNILITSTNNFEAKKIAVSLAGNLNTNFVDLNELINEKLQEDDVLKNISTNDIDKIKYKTIDEILKCESSVVLIDKKIIFEQKNVEKFKKNAIILYFRYKKCEILTNKLTLNNVYAFEIEDKLLQQKCDATIEISKDTVTKNILEQINYVLIKERIYDN